MASKPGVQADENKSKFLEAPKTEGHRPVAIPKLKSTTEKPQHTSSTAPQKIRRTEAQEVMTQIIDWKRCSVRSLLLIAYSTLIYFVAIMTISFIGYKLVRESFILQIVFFGFLGNLTIYFFGSGGAIQAISFVWSPVDFYFSIGIMLVAVAINIGLYFVGTLTSSTYDVTNGLPNKLLVDCANPFLLASGTTLSDAEVQRLRDVCDLIRSGLLRKTISFLPLVLPPIALVFGSLAVFAANYAVKIVPKKFSKGTIDAKFVEPYATYDFYVGRVTNRSHGFDDGLDEQSNVVTMSQDGSRSTRTDVMGLVSLPGKQEFEGDKKGK